MLKWSSGADAHHLAALTNRSQSGVVGEQVCTVHVRTRSVCDLASPHS